MTREEYEAERAKLKQTRTFSVSDDTIAVVVSLAHMTLELQRIADALEEGMYRGIVVAQDGS